MTLQSKGESRREFVGPVKAAEYLGLKYPRQRPLNDGHVEELAVSMERGEFRAGTNIDIGVLPDGTLWLLNGQHTLSGIIHVGSAHELTVITHKCANVAEADALYATFDNVRMRSLRHAMYSAGMADETGLTTAALHQVSSAQLLIESGFTVRPNGCNWRRKNRAYRMECTRGYVAEMKQYLAAIDSAPKLLAKTLRSSGCCSVALTLLKHQGERAFEFFRAVADDSGLRKGDPQKTLRDVLMTGGGADTAYVARAVAAAWNRFFQFQDLKFIRVPDRLAPMILLGTPHSHGKVSVAA